MSIAKSVQIVFITHKEIMKLWNISQLSAKKRLYEIRGSLNKKRRHKLTVSQFCQAEDISEADFYKMFNN